MAEKLRRDFSLREINLLFYRQVFSVTIFLYIFGLFLAIFYVIGNYKNFMDESQSIIMLCLSVIAVLLIFFAVIGIIENIVLLIGRVKIINRFISLFWMFLFVVSGIVMLFFSYIIKYLSDGLVL